MDITARVVIFMRPSGEPGFVLIGVHSELSDGSTFTTDEIIKTLEVTLEGVRNGTITPMGRHRRDN